MWVLLLLVPACQERRPIVPHSFLPDPVLSERPVPSYSDLVERYNAHATGLDRLWSGTEVELAWRDDEGDDHFEQGGGNFLFVRPDRVALTVEKLGKTYLWAGADEERFWLFDRQGDAAYVGRHANLGKPCMEPLPLPIRPSLVPYLLGLMPLDPADVPREPAVEIVKGHYLIEPPGMGLRLLLDPDTARPVRVDLTDPAGYSVITATLSDYKSVPVAGSAASDLPALPSLADLYVRGREARMTLRIDRASGDGDRIRDAAFDFDRLTRAMKPDEVVVLDRNCGQGGPTPPPAAAPAGSAAD